MPEQPHERPQFTPVRDHPRRALSPGIQGKSAEVYFMARGSVSRVHLSSLTHITWKLFFQWWPWKIRPGP